jgi:hypothetical protein
MQRHDNQMLLSGRGSGRLGVSRGIKRDRRDDRNGVYQMSDEVF